MAEVTYKAPILNNQQGWLHKGLRECNEDPTTYLCSAQSVERSGQDCT